MKRRTTELLLLLAATPIILLLFALAILNDGQDITFNTLAVPIGLFVAFIAAHLFVRKLTPNADPALLPITFVLAGIGIAFVMRLSPDLATHQIAWLFISIAAMIVTLLVVKSIRKLGEYKYIIMLAGVILLLLPAIIGVSQNGSKIWLSFGGVFSFQPGEIAKILIVLFLAAYLADNREMLSVSRRRLLGIQMPDMKTLAPLILMLVLSMLIVVFESDLGSALLFFGLFLVLIYVATGRLFYVIISVLLAAVAAVGMYYIFGHVQERVAIWLNPFQYAQDEGYQIVQALYSLANGGLFGTGIGRGMPTLIPVVSSDFIFDAISEEMGLLGGAAILILFVLFAVRGLTIASRAKSDMEAFSAAGLTAAISLQAFVIVGGVTCLIPLTGVTLPFMSQGGSSLLASFIIVGLLLRISDNGTGLETEMQGKAAFDGGVLGRVALGKRLVVLITVFSALFAILIGNLTYQMIIRANDINAMPSNNHVIAKDETEQRGSIVSADNVVLAQSVANGDGTYTREYPQGSLAAQAIGYMSQKYGTSGVESNDNSELSGSSGFATWTDAINAMAGIQSPGNDVQLTLNTKVQQAAQDALDGYNGGAVVLDAKTGEVLAEASNPTYDINSINTIMSGTGTDSSGSSILVNRATGALYAPGSTFKMVTLTAALYSGKVKLTDTYNAPGSINIGNAPVTNFDQESGGNVSVETGFKESYNTVFGQIADKIGASTLVSMANSYGFDRDIGQDFDAVDSVMPNPSEMTEWETAWAGAGEPVGEHTDCQPGPQVTVMQMAMVAGTIGNNGTEMNPYITKSVSSPSGQVLSTTQSQVLSTVASPDVMSQVQQAMEAVVKSGTGTGASISGYTVRGKTGTAETSAKDNSWFAGYVDVGGRTVAVAIVLEGGPEGSATTAAKSIFEGAINVYK
ncbi:MAG: FtsW/RodA/SpoVE family cell cycle protein [Coriobacteriales bacterium]|jgi:peptidoglycan glycosyltransferase|nr:FtsW/RodA/SpoVE family cell cycle protein [Coriobacteriales bacterium]